MRLLVVASMYPHPGHPFSGIFNQNCVHAAERHGHQLVVLAPRPYVPPFLAVHPRWAAYTQIPKYAENGSVIVHRPDLIQVPRFGVTFQRNQGAFLQMRNIAAKLHRQHNFDVVFSFDLSGAGGLAWRLGRHLNLPSTGWAFGLDVRVPHESSDAAELNRMLDKLDLVFYQSTELRDCAATYTAHGTLDEKRHIVLPHGIPAMTPAAADVRQRKRKELNIPEDAILILFLSRIVRGKGIEELLTAFERASEHFPSLYCIAVGAAPGFDDSAQLSQSIEAKGLASRFRMLPGCEPRDVGEYHASADIFAFPSHSEGMPNALLEAMALGTPSVVFDIPPIRDILSHGACLAAAKSFDAIEFGSLLSELAGSVERRAELAAKAEEVVTKHYDIGQNMKRALSHVQAITS